MMFGNSVFQTLTNNQAQVLAQSYLDQARLQKIAQHFEVALVLYDQAKVTFKNIADTCQVTPLPLSQIKSAFSKAQTSQEEVLRQSIAEVYFERAKLLKKLGNPDKAQASYKKAQAWGYEEIKSSHIARAMSLPVPGVPAVVQTAMSATIPAQQKSALVDYLFEKALSTLRSLDVSNKPSLFLVYAHDNPEKGRAEASTSKYLIKKLSQLRIKLHSDQTPMAQPYSGSLEDLKEDGKLENILTSQLCLLPTPLRGDVKPVDKVVLCCSEVLGSYLKWPDYKKFHQELRDAYYADEKTYLQDDTKSGTLAIRRVIRQFADKEDFHHVLTEIAFLQIRAEKLLDKHGIVPVSLIKKSYEHYLKDFIEPTDVRIDDIPRFEERAKAGKAVYQNQSRHWVLFKLIERLLASDNEATTFLNKFWQGYSNLIYRLENESSTPGDLEFVKLVDSIYDDIRTTLQSQLAFTVQQEYQQLQILNADPIDALKEQYFAAIKQNKAFEETLQLYVDPRGKVDQETSTFDLLYQVKAFLNDKDVILLTGDSGAGKTTFNRFLEKQLWEQKKENDAIPLFISLATVDEPEDDLIAKTLKKRGLSEIQIEKLKKKKQKFVFILDGYDEIRQTQNLYLSNGINQPGGWHGRMVISCRSEYLGQDYRSQFQPNPNQQDNDPFFQEVMVEPFSEKERNEYLEKYVKHNSMGWEVQRYQEALEQQQRLKELVSTPFLLRIVVEALPYLENKGQAQSAVQLRMDLYDQFVRLWFERNRQRLSTQDLTGTKEEIFRALSDEGFAQHGLRFVKDLAVHLYTKNAGKPVVDYSLFNDEGNWKNAFFGLEDKQQLLREAWPLRRSGNQYRFIHKSLLEYFAARSLFETFDACRIADSRQRRGSDASIYSFEDQPALPPQTLCDVSLAPTHWVGDLGVTRWLTERVEQEPTFKKQLLSIIERSKTDTTVRQAAANAITILIRAGVQFNGADLKGIQIPGADLSEGVFDHAQLQEADLRKVNLRKIWLRQANLDGAKMAGVQFGELPSLKEGSAVMTCAYSPDGKFCAVGLQDGTINVYNASNWEIIHPLRGHTADVRSVVYSPDGQQIASCSEDGTVRLWEAQAGKLGHTLSNHTGPIWSVAYSPNSQQIASGSENKTVRLWNVQSGKPGHVLRGHSGPIWSVAYSPNGQQIASGSEDATLRLWNAQSGELLHTLGDYSGPVFSVAYSPDGQQIASGSGDRSVRLFDVQFGKLRSSLYGHTRRVSHVVYSPNGQQIASSSLNGTIRLWDIKSGQFTHILTGHNGPVWSLAYSPNGQYIASGSEDTTVRLWNTQSDQLNRPLYGHTQWVRNVVYSPGGQQIASGGYDEKVHLWNVQTGQICHTLSGIGSVRSVVYSPNGQQIASGSAAAVQLWNAKSGGLLHTLRGHDGNVRSVVYSPDSQQIASGSEDNTVRLWNAQSGDLLHTLSDHDGLVWSVLYSLDGQQIASSSEDGTVRLWNAQSGKPGHTLRGHSGAVRSIMYSPNAPQIASGSEDKTVRLWDLQSGKPGHILSNHSGPIWSVVYSPNGQQIASGSEDKTVRLWDVQSGQLSHILSDHSGPIWSMAYSPNSKKIASGSEDNTVRIWDVASGRSLAVIQGFYKAVLSVAWKTTPDGNYLVTGSRDKSVRLWQVIEEGDQVQVRLRWSSTHALLTVADTSIQDVQGLSRVNEKLLKQRGTKGEPVSALSFRDVGGKVISQASVVSGLTQASNRGPSEISSLNPSTGQSVRPILSANEQHLFFHLA